MQVNFWICPWIQKQIVIDKYYDNFEDKDIWIFMYCEKCVTQHLNYMWYTCVKEPSTVDDVGQWVYLYLSKYHVIRIDEYLVLC